MRILVLSEWCYPEPDLKALTFAKELTRRGHQVQILTGFPNYPGGKLYPGYRIKFFQRETIEGVEILRVPLFPSHDKSAGKRIFTYCSFAVSAMVLGPFLVRKADVMYVYHPPPTIALPALLIRLFRRTPIVYDIQDMWPDTVTSSGMLNSRRAISMIHSYMNWCYRRFDHIVVLSEGFRKLLIERGVRPEKVTRIYNWSNEINIPEVNETDRGQVFGDRFTILFAGSVGVLQGLDVVLQAARRLKDEGVGKIQFAILGDGVDLGRLKEKAASMNLDNVLFLPRVSNREVGRFLQLADVLLIHLKQDKLFEITVPSKTQAYLMAGKPILAGVKGDAADLITEAKAGLVFQPEDADDLFDKCARLADTSPEFLAAMGESGRRYYQEHLKIEHGAEKFEKIFETIKKK